MATVSVVIPTYNRASVLPRAIDSVLAQTYEDWELLVVDDASTDDTESVVCEYEDPRIHYHRHETNRGGSAARNTGISRASGEYIALLDSDDEWLPRKLERQVSCLGSRSEEWVATYCRPSVHGTGLSEVVRRPLRQWFGAVYPEGDDEVVRQLLLMNATIAAGATLLVRREIVSAIDGFDESFDRHQDWEFLLRVLRHGKLALVDEELVRIHGQGEITASSMVDVKEQFFETFSTEIERLERQGDPVRRVHDLNLARLFVQEGQFRTGLSYASGSLVARPRLYLSMLLGVVMGLRNVGPNR